jgi:hypothetical protein
MVICCFIHFYNAYNKTFIHCVKTAGRLFYLLLKNQIFMKKIRIVTGFMRFTQTKLLQKAQAILQGMTGNPNFPTPTPALTELSAANAAFATALANPKSAANTALKKQLRAVLITILNQLALYVQMNGNNDATILLSSGYSLSKTRQPFGVLAKASNFRALPLHNCMIKLSNKKIAGADSYSYEYTLAPVVDTSVWTVVNSTKASTVITNLTSGSCYAFRVAGIGANPTIVYSDVITSYVL